MKPDSSKNSIADLLVIDKLVVGPIKIEKNRISAPYTVFKGEESHSISFIYSYEEDVFNPKSNSDRNLASILLVQVALNYGLFCRKIVFHGLFDNTDKTVIKDWMENTAREIFVNKIIQPNIFLNEPASKIAKIKHKNYSSAELEYILQFSDEGSTSWEYWKVDKKKHCVLSSGGKDSLLSYGLSNELGYETHPIFVNESGRHWFTALNAYKYFKENEPNTGKVWVNSDRLFSFMLKHLSFIRKDYQNIRSDSYQILLWTVAVFSMVAVPLLKKRKIGRLIIGDEFDTTVKTSYMGITNYNGLYDQSRYFDDSMSRYFMRKGWAISQFSLLRPLSELLIETILAKRYPQLLANQVSCHAAHKKGDRVYPCGKCEKCRRIVGMLSAMDISPELVGYDKQQIESCLKQISDHNVHQEKEGAERMLILLERKGLIQIDPTRFKKLKEHPEVVNLRFDLEKSPMISIPADLREKLYKIYLEYAEGAMRKISRSWKWIDPFKDPAIKQPYPFELYEKKERKDEALNLKHLKKDFIWANMSWPEAEEKLKIVDTALLPTGAIEQHGPHLPLDVDAADADYLAKSVAEACSDPKPLVLPLISYGVSYHHQEFKGTISLTNDTLARMVYEIGMDVARQGIKKLIIINGHGDNAPTLSYAAQMINRDAKIFVAVDTGETSDIDLEEFVETPNDVHAGELETSTTLAIRPELVNMKLAQKEVLKFSSRYLNYSSSRGIPWYSYTKKISESGVMGNPTKANAKKGKKMWEIMIAHLVAFVEDVKQMDIVELHQKRY
jgi:creatinine amidohydrolase/Fe(II)-dependent formamide hydrolase-like protein